jgi:AdoMet-dependent heme synthase
MPQISSGLLPVDLLGRSADAAEANLSVHRLEALQRANLYPTSFERPMGFQLELTTRCNLRCKHCYNASGKASELSGEMNRKEWDDVIRQIAELRPFQVIISGGEPLLLRDWLFATMDKLDETPTRFVLITNGFLADTSMVERLCRYPYYWVQVSIDGATPEAHDGFRGARGSWDRAVRAAVEFAARGKALVVAHTVHPASLETLPDMVELAAILGATRIICDEAMPVGRAYANRGEITLSPAQRASMAETLYSLQHEYRNRLEVMRTSDPAHAFSLAKATGSRVLLIRPNGDVKLDCVLPFVVGNVRKQRISEIWEAMGRNAWEHPRVQEFISAYQSASDFSACESRPYVDADSPLERVS